MKLRIENWETSCSIVPQKRCYMYAYIGRDDRYVCAPPNWKITAAASSSRSIWQWRFPNVLYQLISFPFFCTSFVCCSSFFLSLAFFILLLFFLWSSLVCSWVCVWVRCAVQCSVCFDLFVRGCNLPVWLYRCTIHKRRVKKIKLPNTTIHFPIAPIINAHETKNPKFPHTFYSNNN